MPDTNQPVEQPHQSTQPNQPDINQCNLTFAGNKRKYSRK